MERRRFVRGRKRNADGKLSSAQTLPRRGVCRLHSAASDHPRREVWIDLGGPSFDRRCYGFWDGERTYRVRVVATAPGQWTWRSGSNQADAGLNGRTGSFVAEEWTEPEKKENPIRRGFVQF